MSEKVKVSRDCSQLKNRTYYIAKVRFFEGNWEHKAFFYHNRDGLGQLWSNSYEQRHDIDFSTFYQIEILEEIKGINE
ncbi:hypothetical protein ACIQ6U_08145 [Lysinibacillus fusiformis]|uniref:hypothetical protein n=1 Tax=Lysinibacillus fusiformis TaxID=28031 RepID=UPI0037FA0A22